MGEVQLEFTDRRGGVSVEPYAELNLGDGVGDGPAAVAENRRRLAVRQASPISTFAWMGQRHGADVAVLDRPVAGPVPGVDALVTATPGLWLTVLVADCAPVLLADRTAGTVAAVHAGRRGLVAGVVPAAVAAMVGRGATPDRIEALIGPAIGGCCYEVSADLAAVVALLVPAAAARTRQGRPAVDLRAGLHAQLVGAGVDTVRHDRRCTVECAELYSYRRDGVTGRFAGLVRLAP
ncbi:MAG TPA: peptidoglycan editing factor PgeF [Mycobacteriales bacterium]|nr:peptidoglycan editing factor PgeF [Mycobacteriales bacterium]